MLVSYRFGQLVRRLVRSIAGSEVFVDISVTMWDKITRSSAVPSPLVNPGGSADAPEPAPCSVILTGSCCQQGLCNASARCFHVVSPHTTDV